MADIAVIKYPAGNIGSIQNALKRLGVSSLVTDDPTQVRSADRVIFPGVGEAKSTMAYLEKTGLDELIRSLEQPFLGICLGMQLMCEHSEEGQVNALGVFDLPVRRFQKRVKIPHMGWNQISNLQSPLFEGVNENSYVYFVHSYYVQTGVDTVAVAQYGESFSAALARDSYYATQFHPEKSGPIGQQILLNFLNL